MAVLNCNQLVVVFLLAVSSAVLTEDAAGLFEMPEECKGKLYCSVKPKGYELLEPKIDSLLPEFFQKPYQQRNGDDCKTRTAVSKEYDDNCRPEVQMEYMYMYQSQDDPNAKADIIIQTKYFKQCVKVVKCPIDQNKDDNVRMQCFKDVTINSPTARARCVESHANRTLYVYDESRSKIVQKYFKVPACCSCKVTIE